MDEALLDDRSALGARRHLLESVLHLVAGRGDLAEVSQHMVEDVAVHLDAVTFRGVEGWRKWMRYQRRWSTVKEVELRIDGLEQLEQDRLRVRIAGRGRRAGRCVEAEPVEILYRFAAQPGGGEKLTEMWTSRRNYVFFFGPSVASWWGFAWLLVRIVVWCWLEDRRAARRGRDTS